MIKLQQQKLLSKSNNNPLIYSWDIYQIGPQETI